MKSIILWTTLLIGLTANASNVDLDKSSFTWTGSKVTGKHFGAIKLKSANLSHDKAGQLKGGEFVMNMDSIQIEDLSGEWAEKFLTHIKSSDFFDVKKFPIAKLKIKSVKGNIAKASMTIKGKTNDVEVKFSKKSGKIIGELKFDRTKFDMIYGSGNFFKNLGDKTIHNEVSVKFSVVKK
jgi:polyisoprenoid-binding protein YceI